MREDPEAIYDYTDEKGVRLYQEVRLPGKRFFLRRPDGAGGWINNLDGVPRVLFNLPAVRSSEIVVWVEGAKDANTVIDWLGLVATTCVGGARAWRPEYALEFAGKTLIVLRDNDLPGLELRERVVRDSRPYATRIAVVELPGVPDKGDVTDWRHAGHSVQEFLALIDAAPAVEPEPTEVTIETTDIKTESAATIEKATVPMVETGPSAKSTSAGSTVGTELPLFPETAWTGLFAEYRDLVGPTTEAPDVFHWCVLSQTIALGIGRKRYVTTPHPLFCNTYIVVIGETGDSRKSTAVEYGEELRSHAGVPASVVGGLLSAEGLYTVLTKGRDTRAWLVEDEGRMLLAAAARPATRNLLPHLCYLYRCPERATLTRREGIVTAEEPFLCLLTATTPGWLRELGLEEEVLTSGFLNRCLLITAAPKAWLPRPKPPAREEFKNFGAHLSKILEIGQLGQHAHRVELDKRAEPRWDEWYLGWRKRRLEYSEAERQLTARTHNHALKTALIYSVVRGHQVITVDDLEIGLVVADHCETLARHLLGDLTLSRMARLTARVLAILDKPGAEGIPGWKLRQLLGGRWEAAEVARALRALEEVGEIAIESVVGSRGPAGIRIRRVEG